MEEFLLETRGFVAPVFLAAEAGLFQNRFFDYFGFPINCLCFWGVRWLDLFIAAVRSPFTAPDVIKGYGTELQHVVVFCEPARVLHDVLGVCGILFVLLLDCTLPDCGCCYFHCEAAQNR